MEINPVLWLLDDSRRLRWVVWVLAFVKPRRQAAGHKEVAKAPASKWGIGLVMLSFVLPTLTIEPAP